MTRLIAALISATLLVGCASKYHDIQVATDRNDKIDLAGYSTYAWAAEAAVIRDPNREWTPANLDIASEIRFLVDRELRKKGFTEVATDPDMLVIYGVGVDMKALQVVVEDDQERTVEVPRGDLLIILADPESRQLAWAGAATAELQESPTADLTRDRLDHAISEMFKGYIR